MVEEKMSRKEARMRMNLDAIDMEAEREGSAIQSSNENRPKKVSKKAKTKSVNSKVLDDAFIKWLYSKR